MKIIDIPQGTPEWLAIRIGKITGTRIKDVMKAENLPLLDELIAELITEQVEEIRVNDAMKRGTEMEPVARQAYEEATGQIVDEFGFLLSEKHEWLGMSPDGLVKRNGIYSHGIEIKCPSTAKHVQYIRQKQVPNEYKYQVMSMYLINENLQTHDFISYDDRFTPKPMFIVSTTREMFADQLPMVEDSLVRFWEKVMKYYGEIIF